MYGTVARLKLLPGRTTAMNELARELQREPISGHLATFVYRAEEDPDECWLAVLFESRDAYVANADSPEQDQRYRRMRDLLAADPEWHDGEVLSWIRKGGFPMARMMVDCRKMPSESNCTLTLIGEEQEVVRAASEHAVSVHGHDDSPELREEIRHHLEPEASYQPGMRV